MNYRQCLLNKKTSDKINGLPVVLVDYAWIPTRLISMGKTLKINGADGWTIIDIFEPEISQEELRERERDYIYQRVASDI